MIEKVVTRPQKREWLDMVDAIYAENSVWIRPLDSDIEAIFDDARNRLFEDGEASRWLYRDTEGRVVGRIAAFYNRAQADTEAQPTGGAGFFECIDDQKVADALFDTAREWLAERGMEAMDAPINFGSRDEWWGCLVEGFEIEPLYANPYNLPYYGSLFENYGFKNYFNQYTYHKDLAVGTLNGQVGERYERLVASGEYTFSNIKGKRLREVAEDFRTIYNAAWAHFSGVSPMTKEGAQAMMRRLRPIIDRRLIYFAYHNGLPVGFYIMIPDLNRIIKNFKGKFGLFQKIKLIVSLHTTRKADRIFGIVFGILPIEQGKGVESGIIAEFERAVASEKLRYRTLELAWMGDFNPLMIKMVDKYVQATKCKTHVTYRYLFDRHKEFRRCPKVVRNN